MKRGRKPAGLKLVDEVTGSEFAKKRAQVILRNIAGDLTVEEACEALDIKRSRFYKLRAAVAADLVESCEPRPAGRPSEDPGPSKELEEAQRQNALLKKELKLTRAQAELSAYLSLNRMKKKRNPSVSKNDGRGKNR